MHIRYGFDIALDLAQPTTILTMMDVHSDCRHAVVGETEFELSHCDSGGQIHRPRRKYRQTAVRAGRLSVAAA